MTFSTTRLWNEKEGFVLNNAMRQNKTKNMIPVSADVSDHERE